MAGYQLRTYAGKFDKNNSQKTGYSLMTGSAQALFGGDVDNDLVVSVESATLNLNYRVLPDCTHFDFFGTTEVKNEILNF